VAEMEEGGRDKTPVQSQQPSATTPSGADEKSSGKERRDAGEKDKEQELVRRSLGSPRRRPWAESLLARRPRARLRTAHRTGETQDGATLSLYPARPITHCHSLRPSPSHRGSLVIS
jgi:hypothetical protein